MLDYSMYPTEKFDWTYVNGNTQEEMSYDMSTPKGKEVFIMVFADANIYHDYVTGRLVTGLLMLLNKTPIDWYSKRKDCDETAPYGLEFMAARIGTKTIVELCYMLRMLGVPISGPSCMLEDMLLVVISSSILDDKLVKRHNALSYHRVR